MKISFKIVGVVGWNALSDVTQGDATDPWSGSFKDVLQVTPGFGSLSQSVVPESNTLVTLRVPLAKSYSSYQAAMAAIRIWRTTLKGKGIHLQYIQDGETQYYPNGGLSDMDFSLKGKVVEYTFTFQQQDLTLVEPKN